MTPSLCFSQSVYKTCPKTTYRIKTLLADSLLKFHKICEFENHVTRNDVIMMSLPKTMEDNGKMRTSAEPSNIYIF